MDAVGVDGGWDPSWAPVAGHGDRCEVAQVAALNMFGFTRGAC